MIERQIVIKTICPAELRQDIPAEPVMPDNAVIDASDATLRWLAAIFSRADLLADRLRDARSNCPDG